MDKTTPHSTHSPAANGNASGPSDTPDSPGHAAASTSPSPSLRKPSAGNALSTMQQVIELADGLSDVADRLHERVLAEIARHDGRAVPDRTQATMRALLDDEMLLRQRANALYADAAAYVIGGLAQSQARLVALTAEAADKIRRIGIIGEVTSLVGGVLALAGAVASGQPTPIVLAIEKIHFHNAALKVLTPPAA